MPHIIVKIAAGRSEEQKMRLAERLVTGVVTTLNTNESAVSVAIEDVRPEDWAEHVYKPDIAGNWERLYKKPGYNPFEG
jgi:4-oxalocrotonate tautomerase